MSTHKRSGGFTMVEMLIVLALFSILALIGLPALLKMMARQSLISAARENAALMRQARFTAIKRGIPTAMFADYGKREFVVFVDNNGDCVLDPTDERVGQQSIGKGVELWGPTDAAAGGANAAEGFPFPLDLAREGCARFLVNGAAAKTGAFRFRGRDEDFLEVRVAPAATGRIAVRKWFGGDPNLDVNWSQKDERADRKWW